MRCGVRDTYSGILRNKQYDIDFVIVMELDLKMKTLSFGLSEQSLKPAFENIKCGEDIQYKMAVSFENKDSKVQLIKYEESGCESSRGLVLD